MTVAATLATGPLVAFHFGAVPLAGLVANLLALPAVAPAMWLGMLKAALGMASAALPPAGAAADRLGPMTRIPLAYLEHSRSGAPISPEAGSSCRSTRPPPWPRPTCSSPWALFALRRWARGVGRRSRGAGLAERTAAWRRAPRSFRVAVLLLVITVLALVTATGLGSPAPPGDLTVRFLDVGQGDATSSRTATAPTRSSMLACPRRPSTASSALRA